MGASRKGIRGVAYVSPEGLRWSKIGSRPVEILWPAGYVTGGDDPRQAVEAAWLVDEKPTSTTASYMEAIAKNVHRKQRVSITVDSEDGFLVDLALHQLVRILRWEPVVVIDLP